MKSFENLWEELNLKLVERPADSKTLAELDSGVHTIGKKIIEEAAEVWMAAEYEDDQALSSEISQLIYHIQVLMLSRGIKLEDVYRNL